MPPFDSKRRPISDTHEPETASCLRDFPFRHIESDKTTDTDTKQASKNVKPIENVTHLRQNPWTGDKLSEL